MPTGTQDWRGSDAPVIRPAPAPGAGTPTSALGELASANFWAHFTFDNADGWTPLNVPLAQPAIKVECYAPAGDDIYIALDRDISANSAGVPNKGAYDLFVPGGSALVKAIPPTRRLVLRTSSNAGAGPTGRVELYVAAGVYVLME